MNNEEKPGSVWLMHGGHIFILAATGRKYYTGLVIEADGWHSAKVPIQERLRRAHYRGQTYPTRKMRGHLRRYPAATKGAARLRKELMK